MNATVRKLPVSEPAEAPAPSGLALLRSPFPDHQISKLPKPTKAQTEAVQKDYKVGIRCKVCGSWHHPEAVHLDYVGHAALTDRLLDCDPEWSWEPAAFREGLPAFDATGGLWIKLTVCGVTRLGYGHAAGKANMDPGAREKEVIGDALRNAAMRFGAALDLWHKGALHLDETEAPAPTGNAAQTAIAQLQGIKDPEIFKACWAKNKDGWKAMLESADYASVVAVMKECAAKFSTPEPAPAPADPYDISEDEIPF